MKLSRIDRNKSDTGEWLFLDDDETAGFLIARMGNTKSKEANAKYVEPYTSRGNMSVSRQEKLANKVFAEAILIGWKGIQDEHGKPFTYSVENAEAFLNDPAYSHYRLDIVAFATDTENFRAEEIKESGNGSKNTSAGS